MSTLTCYKTPCGIRYEHPRLKNWQESKPPGPPASLNGDLLGVIGERLPTTVSVNHGLLRAIQLVVPQLAILHLKMGKMIAIECYRCHFARNSHSSVTMIIEILGSS